ncbi:peroxisomal catalase [Grosmannia clavigera kw1407]|uniref:Peroxisomal catalase n=1 Tax=Grosmannia clavigera (strain kw1407 / UAMH 11150) TaxID=655863 RepID=F0XL66_GROCL|nr:peroxisomal catalase [Grosmannia clavigera kw1407]EFX01755.1 peroxisomal catalase [Grosmannia clavigera kw1407]
MAKGDYTLAEGCPYPRNDTSVQLRNGGGGGLVLLQDTQLIETLAHFARERIPERVVHAKAAGAYGEFEVTHDCTDITSASFLNKVGKKTKVLLRISTVGPERGSADTTRDVHGWAMKLYTDEGNLDWVFNNTDGTFKYIKVHIKTTIGVKNFDRETATKVAGENPDHLVDDLFGAIEKGNYPVWEVFVQVMDPKEAETYKYNIFDMTKVWSHKDFPLRPIGRLTMNRNPRNYFADIEQAAFSPSNMVPGWAPSADPMLQARMFAYPDAARYRLGVNYQQLPTNHAVAPVYSPFQRDGFMTFTENYGEDPNYIGSMLQPTTFRASATTGKQVSTTLTEHEKWVGEVSSYTSNIQPIDFEQAAGLWKVLGREPGHQNRLVPGAAAETTQFTFVVNQDQRSEGFEGGEGDVPYALQQDGSDSQHQSAATRGIPTQLLTGLNHALAGCQLDPFDMFPVRLTAQHHRLLHHWLCIYATMMFEQPPADAFNPMRDVWFPLDLSNAASFNAIMAHSAAHLARLNGIKFSREAFRYKAEALRIVRLWMQDPARTLSDEVFAAVLRLLTYERYWGTEAEWRVHRDGLQQMIEARGGIASLHSNWRLELVTYLYSVSLMSRPSWFDSSNNLFELSEQPQSTGLQSADSDEHLQRVRGLWLLSFIQDMRTFLVDCLAHGSRTVRQYNGVQEATLFLQADMKRRMLDPNRLDESDFCSSAEFQRLACIFFICILLQTPLGEPSFPVDSSSASSISNISSVSGSISSISGSTSDGETELLSKTSGLALMDAFLLSSRGQTESVEDLYTRLFYQFAELPDIDRKTKYALQMTHVLASLSNEARRGVERCLLRIMRRASGGEGHGGDYGRQSEEHWTPDDLLSSIRGL